MLILFLQIIKTKYIDFFVLFALDVHYDLK